VGLVGACRFARHCRLLTRFFPMSHRLACLLRASLRLAAGVISPLRFAITSPPSGREEVFTSKLSTCSAHKKKPGQFSTRAVVEEDARKISEQNAVLVLGEVVRPEPRQAFRRVPG
jgi:hypothetical protein